MNLLEPLDYARQALWNLPASLGKGDILGALPGLLGGAAGLGLAATGFGAPLALLGGSLAGGLGQGIGKATGSDSFEAPGSSELVKALGMDPDSGLGLAAGFGLHLAGDPLTYAGLGFGHKALEGSRDLASLRRYQALDETPVQRLLMQGEKVAPGDAGFLGDIQQAHEAGTAGRTQHLGNLVGGMGREANGPHAVSVVPDLDPALGYAKYHDLLVNGVKRGSLSLGPPGATMEQAAAEALFPGVVQPGQKVARIQGIEVDPLFRGQGLGQELYLQGLHGHGADWYFNSQASPEATRALEALQRKGLAEVLWQGDRSLQGGGGSHLVRLTDAGRQGLAGVGSAGGSTDELALFNKLFPKGEPSPYMGLKDSQALESMLYDLLQERPPGYQQQAAGLLHQLRNYGTGRTLGDKEALWTAFTANDLPGFAGGTRPVGKNVPEMSWLTSHPTLQDLLQGQHDMLLNSGENLATQTLMGGQVRPNLQMSMADYLNHAHAPGSGNLLRQLDRSMGSQHAGMSLGDLLEGALREDSHGDWGLRDLLNNLSRDPKAPRLPLPSRTMGDTLPPLQQLGLDRLL